MQTVNTKRSKQRERIFQTLKKTGSHPTAEWVFDKVREQMPKISLGTVYRNLNILKQQGKVRELDFGETSRRYDAFVDEHYHFVCDHCGIVKDLDLQPQADINERVKNSVPGVVRTHRLDFFGTCSECLLNE